MDPASAGQEKSLSLKLKKRCRKSPDPERFPSPGKSLDEYQEQYIPENTKVNTRWAVKNFEDWAASYNMRNEEKCPDGVLLSDDTAELSLWLQKYVIRTKIARRSLVSLIRRGPFISSYRLQKTILIYPFCIRMCRCLS